MSKIKRNYYQKIAFFLVLNSLYNYSPLIFAANATPDAGEVLRLQQQSSTRIPTPDFIAEPEVRVGTEEKALTDSQVVEVPVAKPDSTKSLQQLAKSTENKQQKILVKGFSFTGLETVPEPLIQKFLSKYIGSELTLQQLHGVAAELETYLRTSENLMIALAYLPAQAITDGIVQLGVYEGKLTELRFVADRQKVRLNPEHIRDVIKYSINSKTINSDELESALSRLNQIPGITAKGVIIPEVTVGHAKIKIEVKEGEIFAGEASLDSFGSRVTGTEKANVELNINDPFGGGGQVKLKYSGSQYTHYGNIQTSMPVTGMGIRIGAQATYSNYQLCCEFASLDSNGNSTAFGLFANYILQRTISRELFFRSNLDLRNNRSLIKEQLTSSKSSYVLNSTLQGSLKNKLLSGGLTQWSTSVAFGKLKLKLPSEQVSDSSSYQTAGNYVKVNYTLNYAQWLNNTLSVNFNSFGQYALKNLDSVEKFSLGGSTSVRAYPNGEASGDSGLILSGEIRDKLTPMIVYGLFYDYGKIKLWHSPIATNLNQYSLSGAGAYLELLPYSNVILRAVAAKKIGSNPGQRDNGSNADGRNLPWQFWLQGVYQF